MRIWLWETQRRYFRAYLKAAQAEQRAIRNALTRAKPGDLAALRARGGAAHAGEEVALAEPVAGRLPPNHQYAGGEFPRDLLPSKYRKQGLRFTSTGHPEFEPFAMKLPNGQKQVRIAYTGSYEADKIAARKAAGFQGVEPRGWTWHHAEGDLSTMLLVPQDLHEAVRHAGGVADYKHLTGVGYAR
jgi:hypothetical protein